MLCDIKKIDIYEIKTKKINPYKLRNPKLLEFGKILKSLLNKIP